MKTTPCEAPTASPTPRLNPERRGPQISPRLRRKLLKQRAELFEDVLPEYPALEARAILALKADGSSAHLTRAAFRRWWLDRAGEIGDNWEPIARTEIPPVVATIETEIEAIQPLPRWINLQLLHRTIVVLQSHRLLPFRAKHALDALQSVGRLAILGV